MNARPARPPVLLIRFALEEPLVLIPVCETEDDELRLAAYVDRALTRRPGLVHAAIADWMVSLLEEAA